MTKFSNKLKKLCFWPIFQFFPALSRTTSHGILAPCRNLEKKIITQFQENGRTVGRTDRPYFIAPFRLPPEVQRTVSERVEVEKFKNKKLK